MAKVKRHYSIDIKAPKQKVWEIMLADETYREWTTEFNPAGSWYEGDWSEGSKILFLGPSEDGGSGGMVSEIAESRPYDFVSIKHNGVVNNGVEDTTSEEVQKWAGAYENYTFTEHDGVTKLEIDMDLDEDEAEHFDRMWPNALEKLKEIIEG